MSTVGEERGVHMRRAAKASLFVSVLLVSIKTYAYFASNSVAMLASLADSSLDLFTAALNIYAIHEALTPADEEHRFGHGKAEPLAGLGQGAFICASAVFLVVQAVQRLITPQPIDHSLQVLAVMGISILAAIILLLYQRRVVAKTGSVAVTADAMHYFGDLVSNIGVVAAILLVSWAGWIRADPVIALLVALVLVVSAWSVFRASLDQLMDHELPGEERQKIIAIVRRHPEVRALHELRTRKAGLAIFIQVHIELDPAMPLSQVHTVSDQVEASLCAAYPHAEVIIHQDPAGLEPQMDLGSQQDAGARATTA
jgi:ferrous-iron efflux pump FieF